jgi:ankyrin repeat protein
MLNGSTALINAVYRGDHDMVQLLLDSGADPTLANKNGRTPLDMALIMGDAHIVRTIEQALSMYTLHKAAHLKGLDQMRVSINPPVTNTQSELVAHVVTQGLKPELWRTLRDLTYMPSDL